VLLHQVFGKFCRNTCILSTLVADGSFGNWRHLSFCAPIHQTPCTRYNWLSNRLNNRLHRVNKHSTGCSAGLKTGWMFVSTIQPVVQPRLSNCTNERSHWRLWNPVYTMQPIVQSVIQPLWQPAVSCIQTFNRLNNRSSVCVHDTADCPAGCQTNWTTGWTTSCVV